MIWPWPSGGHSMGNLAPGVTPQLHHLFRILQLTQSVQRRPDSIKRVSAPKRLRNYVVGPNQLHDRTHGTTGNNPRTLCSWFKQHMFAAKQSVHFMRNRPRFQRHVDQMLLCPLYRFPNGYRDFGSLPLSNPHPPLSITDYNQSAKIEPLPAFDDFRDTVDEHHFIFKVQLIWINSHAFLLLSLDQLSAVSQKLIAEH